MARILEYPLVRQIDDKLWRLEEDLEYKVHNDPSKLIIVPKGYITDFASVPRLFWNILPPFGKYSPGAIIHDYIYGLRGQINPALILSRKGCDDVFLEAMEVMGVGWWTRGTMYNAVRCFGWIAW